MPSKTAASEAFNPDTYTPEKKTIGALLTSTSPPICVPDFQRDFSWEKEHVEAFWGDLTKFYNTYPTKDASKGKEYFLGSAVLVNNGDYHLLLDGQQRLATATILTACLREKVREYDGEAADHIHRTYIVFEDKLEKATKPKLTLNIFDRDFFRSTIQENAKPKFEPKTRSQGLIKKAYEYFETAVRQFAGVDKTDKAAYEKLVALLKMLTDHMSLITVVSHNEDHAATIFETLNDRGVTLSGTDLLRSFLLQKAEKDDRPEIISCWQRVVENCGANDEAERFIRVSWTSIHGDLKVRSVSKVVKGEVEKGVLTPLGYSRDVAQDSERYSRLIRIDFEDDSIVEEFRESRNFGLRTAFPLLVATLRDNEGEFGKILKAAVSLIVRHSVIVGRDRSELEAAFFQAATLMSAKKSLADVIVPMQKASPQDRDVENAFATLTFSKSEHSTAKALLAGIERQVSGTTEKYAASARKVHVEHIYPQNPPTGKRWADHDKQLTRVGNLTLLSSKLNESEQNKLFPDKKGSYEKSQFKVTSELVSLPDWGAKEIEARQLRLAKLALSEWPQKLV